MHPPNQEDEDELYNKALRATCALCIMEGRCVCGELDPEDEDWEPGWCEEDDSDTNYHDEEFEL